MATETVEPTTTIVDVGHGSATVVQGGGGTVIIDTGKRDALLVHLWKQGVQHIDCLILSHCDDDHIGAAYALLLDDRFLVDRVLFNPDPARTTIAYQQLIAAARHAAERAGTAYGGVYGGDVLWFGDFSVTTLAPERIDVAAGLHQRYAGGGRITANSLSVVVRVDGPELRSVLVPGDLDAPGLAELMRGASPADLQADILVFPHHGGRPGSGPVEPFVKELLTAVCPDHVVFSVGRAREGFPRPATVSAVLATLPQVNVTCTELCVRCESVVPEQPRPYMGRPEACGGDIVFFLRSGATSPSIEAHSRFIDEFVSSPLCRIDPPRPPSESAAQEGGEGGV